MLPSLLLESVLLKSDKNLATYTFSNLQYQALAQMTLLYEFQSA
jgi:hypothetical protein